MTIVELNHRRGTRTAIDGSTKPAAPPSAACHPNKLNIVLRHHVVMPFTDRPTSRDTTGLSET